MSTISGVSSSSNAWSEMRSSRAGAMDKMFSKVDSDGSGSVDTSELQSMLDNISNKTGQSIGNAGDLMSKMDTDGNGTLSESELDKGMKSLMPPPSSTVDFAQQRTDGSTNGSTNVSTDGSSTGTDPAIAAGDGSGPTQRVHHHHHHDGPPPGDGSTSSSNGTDPLATNGDGGVSPQDKLAGDVKSLMSDLVAAADTNGDGSLNTSEIGTLKTQFDNALDAAISSLPSSASASSGSASSGSSSSSSSDGSSQDASLQQASQALSTIVEMMLKQYSDAAAATATSTTAQASTLNVAA